MRELLRLHPSFVTTFLQLPAHVPRSGGAAMTGERVGPGAHPAAPGLIPGPSQLHKSNHRSTCAPRTPLPSHRIGRPCRRIPPTRNRSARTAKEKARSRTATGSFAVNDVAGAASSGDRPTNHDRTERSTRPRPGHAPPSIRALRTLQNACARASEIRALPFSTACLRRLQNSSKRQ